jgi:sugar phosphate isomerase/epimerase
MKTNPSRRDFLKVSAAGALTASLLSQYSCSTAPQQATTPQQAAIPGIGLQLYTIRDAMAADVPGSLKKVADMGYKYLELADYANGKFYGKTPPEFRKLCDDLGLEIISSHTQVEGAGVTLENAKIMAEDHVKLGVKYCLQPWIVEEMRTTIASYQRMAANWNKIGAIMKEHGMQFGYHNHNFEFATVEGKVPYFDVLLAELDKDLVVFELDMFWTTKAGHNPIDIIKQYPGRFHLFHLKDSYTKTAPFFDLNKADIAPVGEGVIDFKAILAVKDVAGMKYMVVEQDDSRDKNIFGDIQKSITNLKTKILV